MSDTISSQSDDLSGVAVHERVANAVVRAIAEGRYRAGDKLPTHRALAREMSVSIGSVTRAIDTLSARGVVSSEVGRGTFVRQQAAPTGDTQGFVDLSINAPPPLVSAGQWAEASALANERALLLPNGGYVDFTGTPAQRAIIANWISQRRSPMAADDIVLVNGAQQGLHLAFAALKDVVRAVITEGASFPGAIAAAGILGLPALPVARDDEGPLPDALARLLAETGPAAVYLTPVCQNPMGYETGPARRAELARVVADKGGYIVEDDIYGVYSTKPGPLYRDLLAERTFFVTSFSKSLTPLIRLGVIAPPAAFMASVRRRMRAESWGLPPLTAELGAAMIETGIADAVLPVLRTEALARLEMTRTILGLGAMPMPAGAPHVWLPLDPLRAEQLARRASEAGLRLGAPSTMQVGPEPVGGLRLCIVASPNRRQLERGLRILARLLVEDEEVLV
jgi:DNA-binding transcriptional MocR family regulator